MSLPVDSSAVRGANATDTPPDGPERGTTTGDAKPAKSGSGSGGKKNADVPVAPHANVRGPRGGALVISRTPHPGDLDNGHRGRPRSRTASLETIVDVAAKEWSQDRSRLEKMADEEARDGLLGLINAQFERENTLIGPHRLPGTPADADPLPPFLVGPMKRALVMLPESAVARIMAARHTIIAITTDRNSDPDLDMLAFYDDDPGSPTHGIYVGTEGDLLALARRYAPNLSTKGFIEVASQLRTLVPRRVRGTNRDLIAANNCIVDYNGGDPRRIEFSPAYIFVSKLAVDFVPDAQLPVYDNPEGCCEGHSDWVCGNRHRISALCDDDCPQVPECTDACLRWDVESWMVSLFPDDPERVQLAWEVLGAAVRPYVRWGKAVLPFSTVGNNGKGTLVCAMRNLLGSGGYASIPMADMGKDFALEPLIRASAVLVDENDVGGYIDKAANLKAIITNDVISINRKFKTPIAYQFRGLVVQCLNELPKGADKSGSFYRRNLLFPFDTSFTGRERKYIKDDYLQRPEALQYVLKRVLTMSYYELSEPEACKKALEEQREANDPLLVFYEEVLMHLQWTAISRRVAHALYEGFVKRSGGSGAKTIGQHRFSKELTAILVEKGWVASDDLAQVKKYCAGKEPLLWAYRATSLTSDADPMKIAQHELDRKDRFWLRPAAVAAEQHAAPQVALDFGDEAAAASGTAVDAATEAPELVAARSAAVGKELAAESALRRAAANLAEASEKRERLADELDELRAMWESERDARVAKVAAADLSFAERTPSRSPQPRPDRKITLSEVQGFDHERATREIDQLEAKLAEQRLVERRAEFLADMEEAAAQAYLSALDLEFADLDAGVVPVAGGVPAYASVIPDPWAGTPAPAIEPA